MIDHIGICVSDVSVSRAFYTRVLAPLQIACIAEDRGWLGYGRGNKADFWFGEGRHVHAPMHIAFTADNMRAVNEFFTAALSAGATDNGKPGLREHYHAHYYAAFVLDPDGNNIEAVCHEPDVPDL